MNLLQIFCVVTLRVELHLLVMRACISHLLLPQATDLSIIPHFQVTNDSIAARFGGLILMLLLQSFLFSCAILEGLKS